MQDEEFHEEQIEETEESTPSEDIGYRTLAQGFLSPRHRRLCQLAASGTSNAQIAKELDYADSRVSILLKHPAISAEISRLQERIFEETIQQRMKNFADPALNVLERALKDQTNRVKESDKIQVAQWVIEKLDGKAVQKTDIGENLLSVFMDRLDAQRGAPRQVQPILEGEAKQLTQSPPYAAEDTKTAETAASDSLEDWIRDFDAGS